MSTVCKEDNWIVSVHKEERSWYLSIRMRVEWSLSVRREFHGVHKEESWMVPVHKKRSRWYLSIRKLVGWSPVHKEES